MVSFVNIFKFLILKMKKIFVHYNAHTAPESVKRVKSIVERLSMVSFDDHSYLQVHLWRSTSRKMT